MRTIDQQLRELGLTTPRDTVLQVVAHLSRGGSKYALYERPPGEQVVSKGTAEKIERFLKGGQLNFLRDYLESHRVVSRVFQVFGETDAQRREREAAEDAELADEVLEALEGPCPSGAERAAAWDDPLRFARMEAVEAAERLAPETNWSIAGLEAAGVPKDETLGFLVEYDALHLRRVEAEIYAEIDGDRERYMRDFPGIERYLALHYIVEFHRRCPGAPPQLVSMAGELVAKGVLASNNRYTSAGEDLVRYEIWRGLEHHQAYFKSLERYYGTKRALKQFRAQVQRAMDDLEEKTDKQKGAE
ncbi:MAG: hypothetical protein O2913_00940 [Chloroflexi bacterium]|nr:hypothetical protein [Chloroflexota bacterium]